MHRTGTEFANLDWPDGWFVFERGIVKGPFTTKETFSRKVKDEDASSFMVSRKGFGSWYALNDLASVYYQADRIGVSHSASVKDIEDTLSEEINRLAIVESGIRDQRHKALDELDKTSRENDKLHLGAHKGPVKQKRPAREVTNFSIRPINESGGLSTQTDGAQHPQEDPQISATQGGRATLESRRAKVLEESKISRNSEKRRISPPAVGKKSTRQMERELAYNHMLFAGRLRLGSINNPWIEAYPKFFAAFGLYWGFWYRRTLTSVLFHVDASLISRSSRFFWRALIPGYHMFMARKLGSAIAAMERQNGYQVTSPTKAMWLSIFPPWAIFYLQSSINRHWKVHVKHEAGYDKKP